MSATEEVSSDHQRDSADLAKFGYKQELKRSLGIFSSFAVAFSYISPSTGIFTLFALGLTTIGGVFIWTWPIVAAGQMLVALNFAEVSSHYPVAGSVFQWTKYLASRRYSWFTGWIYLFAGILTVTAVVATIPIALIPALNGLGWHSLNAGSLGTQETVALMAFHNHQGFKVVTNSAGLHVGPNTFLVAMFMSLFVIYGFDTASTLAEETRDPRRNAPKAVPFLKYSGAGIIAIAATGMIYLSYFLGNIVIMRARVKGWPKMSAPFKLGRWGMIVNVLALLYGGAMLINFAWPRAATNPEPKQTGGLLSFGVGFLNSIPILWTVVIVIALIGTIYYLVAGRRKQFAPIVTPAADDAPLADSAAAQEG